MDSSQNVAPTSLSPEKDPSKVPAASSPAKKSQAGSDNLSFQEASPSPRSRRKSLRRSVGKNRRRTLPPIYQHATGLSDAISLSLPESDRLVELLRACFQYSVKKLENSLCHIKGFRSKEFGANVLNVQKKMERFIERLSRDGTLKRCVEESRGLPNVKEVEPIEEKVRNDISVLTGECQQWEELLGDYNKKAEEMGRQLEEAKMTSSPLTDCTHVPASLKEVLESKPDYNAILHQQGAVFDNMEIVLDEFQQSVDFIDSFSSATSSHLQQLSTQLQSRSFKPMEDSPVRTFLRVFQR
ncbi:kinetochore-associated protein DSN1 homolog [Gastrophryne carolinensis]